MTLRNALKSPNMLQKTIITTVFYKLSGPVIVTWAACSLRCW